MQGLTEGFIYNRANSSPYLYFSQCFPLIPRNFIITLYLLDTDMSPVQKVFNYIYFFKTKVEDKK